MGMEGTMVWIGQGYGRDMIMEGTRFEGDTGMELTWVWKGQG